jgi:hypothetical protein
MATNDERRSSRHRTDARRALKINLASAPATIKTLTASVQAVQDDDTIQQAAKTRIITEACRVSAQIRVWDAGVRIDQLSQQQQVLVAEIVRLREQNATLARDAAGPPLALQAPPLASALPPLPGPDPVPVKRKVGRPKKDKSVVQEMSLDLAAALVPIPPVRVYHQLEEKHYSGAEDADFIEDS